MKFTKALWVPVVLSLILAWRFPAPQLKEAAVSYKILIDSEEMSFMQKMLFSSSRLVIKFRNHWVRTEFDLGPLSTISILNASKKEGLVLVNILGNKSAAPMKEEDVASYTERKKEIEIIYLDEEKEILGYKCKKALVRVEGEKDLQMFYTDKIQAPQVDTDYTFSTLKGFPLQLQIVQDGTVITLEATDVDTRKLADQIFSLKIPEGYEEKDLEDIDIK